MSATDLSQLSMLDLFRLDAESQVQSLTGGLLALERNPAAAEQLEICMRAAHSLKGAARIVGLDAGVTVTHAMEDCFVAAQRGTLSLQQSQIDLLLSGVDLLNRIANTPENELAQWSGAKQAEIDAFLATLTAALQAPVAAQASVAAPQPVPAAAMPPHVAAEERDSIERVLRVTAENLNRLLGLAGESLVESRWLKPFAESMLQLKRMQQKAARSLEALNEVLAQQPPSPRGTAALAAARQHVHGCYQILSQRLIEIEMFDSRSTHLAHRLYDAALACRMRPFADGVRAFPRMVRDLGRTLGRQVRLEILGETTQVDRDILEKLDAPLGHLLRNAIDHGIEAPQERLAAGKSAEGVVRLEARHSAGLLLIQVSDDGRGIDLDTLRTSIVARKLTTLAMAQQLSEAELLEFLFLPGFSTKQAVTEISGRGVGLDVVQDMIKQVRGTVRVTAQRGGGARFQLQLPLTLSVVRTLLVEISGEPYAFPLAHIVRTLKLLRPQIALLEGRQHFLLGGRSVGLVSAQQVLGGSASPGGSEELCIVVLGEAAGTYGLIVDRFLGERELVVQPLDSRLGKIKDIAAGALMEDGSPVLIVDVVDMLCSVEKLAAGGGLDKVAAGAVADGPARRRVLVVDDSLTVRELERKLLDQAGYDVQVAVDGMDGWNAVRTEHFDLVVTDIDMPRLDGIELVALIKKDARLKDLPVMIVSYKDREEDRRRGLDAGADYYLTKGSFHDETLLRAVTDLIGAAVAA
jgi:two-component system, chemotaxis family, sensor histidine kinase and response regulator WspE